MANFLLNNLFRIAVSTLNFVSPSIVADILLHPFDFATVLLQIGYDPEGIKCQTGTLFSVIVQYALFTFYIPYLLTSMHGLQFMGMPHPSIFYYVSFIYKKEGFLGCYRGLMPKIFERLIMVCVNDRIKKRISKGSFISFESSEVEADHNRFFQTLINNVSSQFFAVLASHPFHVLMVSTFADFTCNKKSSLLELSQSIYTHEGYIGFFTGLTARLLGELLSLIFSVTYTAIINNQLRFQRSVISGIQAQPTTHRATHLVNYVTDLSRFTVFKQSKSADDGLEGTLEPEEHLERRSRFNHPPQMYMILYNFLRSITHHSSRAGRAIFFNRHNRIYPFLAYIPLTSKLFYYIMIRDFLSKKISTPFFLVCHCAIVLDTGWDKFPLLVYFDPMMNLFYRQMIPLKKTRLYRCKPKG